MLEEICEGLGDLYDRFFKSGEPQPEKPKPKEDWSWAKGLEMGSSRFVDMSPLDSK